MILLTGATGFVGGALLKALLEAGYEVGCVKRKTSDCSRVKSVMQECAWYDVEDVERAFDTHLVEAVIHCATDYGRNECEVASVYRSNVMFPLDLLDLAMRHGCQWFVNTDTFFVRQIDCLWQDTKKLYMDSYTKTKYIFTHIVRDHIQTSSLAFINMQMEHIYGAGDGDKKFVSYLLDQLQKNVDQLELTEGLQMRDWIYLKDVLSAYLIVLQKRDRFQPGNFYQFEVGTGKETTLRNFVEQAKEITHSSTQLLFGKRKMQENELMRSCADNQKLCDLGWKAEYHIEDGIREMIEGGI